MTINRVNIASYIQVYNEITLVNNYCLIFMVNLVCSLAKTGREENNEGCGLPPLP